MKLSLILRPLYYGMTRLFGLIMAAFGLFIALSLCFYSPLDPSFNRAVDIDVHNIAGPYGAFLADPLLQFFGLPAILIALVPLCWGIRVISVQKFSLWWLRVLLFVISLLSACIAFDSLAPRQSWVLIHLGGFVGHILMKSLLMFMKDARIIAAIASGLALSSFLIASHISMASWKRGLSTSWWLLFSILKLLNLISSLIIWLPIKYCFKKYFGIKATPLELEDLTIEQALVPSFTAQIKSTFKRKIVDKESKPKQKVTRKVSSNYALPSLDFLSVSAKNKKPVISDSIFNQNARDLEGVLEDFGIFGKITAIHPGPVVTLYELEPAAGTKSSRVIGLADDIARSMSAVSARIAVVPGRNVIGIELPNQHREIVYLKELLEAAEYEDDNLKLPIVLGKDIGGRAVVVDLAKMPHLLVAGTTGSGKSVAINTMILSLVYRLTPNQCKFIMIDPKMLELSVYDGIPHLLTPVVTEPSKAVAALKWVVKEMENRYRLMSHLGVRNMVGYNKRIAEAKEQKEILERTVQTGFDPETGKPIIERIPFDMQLLPFIVVIVDEMADLMLVAGKDIESSIQRLSQMARAAGIHIIMATQRPSVDVITGVIKANFPTRISFQVTSRIDSRTILGEQGGAEQLLGMGDMLYMSGGSKIIRAHGPFVEDREVEKIVSYLKTQGSPEYIEEVTAEEESSDVQSTNESGGAGDLYQQAVEIITRDKKVSTSYIQRCLRIGYNRAADIIERMEREGLITPPNHAGKREILLP